MIPPFHVLVRRLMRLLIGPQDPYLDPLAPWEIKQGQLLRGLVGVLLGLLLLMAWTGAVRLVFGLH